MRRRPSSRASLRTSPPRSAALRAPASSRARWSPRRTTRSPATARPGACGCSPSRARQSSAYAARSRRRAAVLAAAPLRLRQPRRPRQPAGHPRQPRRVRPPRIVALANVNVAYHASMDAPLAGSRMRPLVGILLFDGVEVLDFAGPTRSSRLPRVPWAAVPHSGHDRPDREGDGAGRAPNQAHAPVDRLPTTRRPHRPRWPWRRPADAGPARPPLPFLRGRAAVTPLTASVCTGAFLLGRAGLLDGLRVTTNQHALDALAAEFPAARVEGGKLIDTGRLVTAAGVSSGIDLALHLMERWFGPEARRQAADGLEGPWS